MVPSTNADVIIASGRTIILDTATAALGSLRIDGTLVADPLVEVAITSKSIAVMTGGKLEIGTEASPRERKATITLTGPRGAHTARTEDNGLDNDGVQRGIRVMNGGTLRLIGATPPLLQTRLAAHAPAGATTLQVSDPVVWQRGDRIAVSLTDFYGVGTTEVFTVARCGNGQLGLTTGLQTSRWGLLQYPIDVPINGSGMSLTPGPFTKASPTMATVLDERAHVVNLSRRIVVEGADDADWTNQGFGAHVMVMGLASKAQCRGVEFRRCGQRRAMGRYPFHWHMLSYTAASGTGLGGGAYLGQAQAADHYLRDSSVWASENRGVTIHGTRGVLVDNVYAVDVKGHAFFMEDGAETDNAITNCVAMKVRDPGAANRVKIHDADASGFWLTNPANRITGNSASDCAGRGLWNSFANVCFGLSRNVAMAPGAATVQLYEGNTGHSNRRQGITTDFVVSNEAGATTAQRYEPPGTFTMSRNKVWKNLEGGYLNRVGAAQYVDWTAADNNTRDFQGQTMPGATMRGTLFVGRSLNAATPFADPRRIGVSSYHFTLDIMDIVAVNYGFMGPTIAANSQFVYGGGVFDTSDLYDKAIGLGTFRNSGWRLINSNAGYVTPSPYFDGFPLTTSTPNKYRYWSIAAALWDPFGYWGPAGNYLIPDRPFYTHGVSNLVPVAPAGSNGLSTPHVFHGLADVVLNNETPPGWGGPSLIALRLARLNSSNQEIAEHTIGNPAQALFFPGMRYFSVATGGRYKLTFPGGQMPSTNLRVAIQNAYRGTDRFVIGVPWPGNVPVAGRLDAGVDSRTEAQKVAANVTRLFVNNGTSIASVLADPTGARIWQDTANNIVWVQPRGGMALNVYAYDGRSEESLRRTHYILLRRA